MDVGGWAGNVTFLLKGDIVTSEDGSKRFVGSISAADDIFDFDKKEWGIRKYWAEAVTRAIGHLPGGESYFIQFMGRRYIDCEI